MWQVPQGSRLPCPRHPSLRVPLYCLASPFSRRVPARVWSCTTGTGGGLEQGGLDSCYVPCRCVFVKIPYLRMSVQLAIEGDSSKVHMGFLLCPMSLCVCSISIFTYFCTTGNGGGLEQGAHPFLVMSRFVVCLFKLHIHACLNNGHCRGTGARCLP